MNYKSGHVLYFLQFKELSFIEAVSFFKTCSHIFMIFEVMILEVEQKKSGFAA